MKLTIKELKLEVNSPKPNVLVIIALIVLTLAAAYVATHSPGHEHDLNEVIKVFRSLPGAS
ncbi:MAG: hypothetical protein JSS76_04630 [Bacteroidetes bacterium]|nr:hypothetical protein [Bacteroidota bacterium]